MEKIKGVPQKDHSLEREHLDPTQRDTNRSKAISKAAFMAALAQGIIPQAYGEELRENLSQIGNYAFLQAVQRREARSRALDFYVNKEIFSPVDQNLFLEDSTRNIPLQDNDQEINGEEEESAIVGRIEESNEIEVMPTSPEFRHKEPYLNWLIDDQEGLYSLSPIPFDRMTEGTTGGVTMGDLSGIEVIGDHGE